MRPSRSGWSATEKRIDELKKKPKEFWDIFQIVATLLIPASITLAGYWYSDAQKQAEIRSSENIAAQLRDTSLMQVRVGQAQLISTFMESLLSEKPQRQKLAIEGVLVALPEERSAHQFPRGTKAWFIEYGGGVDIRVTFKLKAITDSNGFDR